MATMNFTTKPLARSLSFWRLRTHRKSVHVTKIGDTYSKHQSSSVYNLLHSSKTVVCGEGDLLHSSKTVVCGEGDLAHDSPLPMPRLFQLSTGNATRQRQPYSANHANDWDGFDDDFQVPQLNAGPTAASLPPIPAAAVPPAKRQL